MVGPTFAVELRQPASSFLRFVQPRGQGREPGMARRKKTTPGEDLPASPPSDDQINILISHYILRSCRKRPGRFARPETTGQSTRRT